MELTHLAVIMDGNGRWAKQRGFRRSVGHKEGVKNIERILNCCLDRNIRVLSLFVFSTENINRPKEEVDGLFDLARDYFKKADDFKRQDIRVVVSGSRSGLPLDIIEAIDTAQTKTALGKRLTLNLCFNYGGRDEILHAARQFALSGKGELNEESFGRLFYHELPPVDFIIRTGGECRLSNFLLWQSAYAELYFTDVLWPDFSESDFNVAIDEYGRRKRNFGRVSE